MAIFSRRDVQAALNQLANYLTQKQLKKIVGELNGNKSTGILANEWEVLVLSAFSRCGRIQYEKNFGGTSYPDLFFQSGKFEFLADITTISDRTTHKENPYSEFCDAIRRFLKKHGHISAGLYVDVKHKDIGEYGNRKVQLLLPAKNEMDRFVKTELGQFLKRIAAEPDKDVNFTYNQDDICFAINYNSHEKRFSGGGHIVPTVPYSIQDNPLATALDDKRSQLANSGYKGIKGIIICDGGSDSLNERSRVNGAYGCREIVGNMFRASASIHFVLVLRIDEKYGGVAHNRSIQIIPQFYWNPALEQSSIEQASVVIQRMLEWLPSPEATPANAIHWLASRNKNVGRPIGAITMQGNTIKISARALTELLAGKTGLKEFLEDHHFKPTERGGFVDPFFERQLAIGNTLRNSFVEPDEHKDDDWIVLEYNGPDSAISPFRTPK